MVEEIKQNIQSNRYMNETHLTKIEVKIKRLLLDEKANQKQVCSIRLARSNTLHLLKSCVIG